VRLLENDPTVKVSFFREKRKGEGWDGRWDILLRIKRRE
jgi:hypothetical protein